MTQHLKKTNMTPKEKAKELVDKFKQVELYDSMEPTDLDCKIQDITSSSFTAKQCALIAVNEILKDREEIDGMRVINDPYWLEVKQEIEKL
jgi:hypothetical protein